jgi:hypothetical protein
MSNILNQLSNYEKLIVLSLLLQWHEEEINQMTFDRVRSLNMDKCIHQIESIQTGGEI